MMNLKSGNRTLAQQRRLLALALLASTALATGCASVQAATVDPQTAITMMLQTEQAAWNAGDSVGYTAAYTDDADFMNIRGQIFTGKTAINMVHAQIFAGPFKGSNLVITVRLFKLPVAGVAVVDVDEAVTNYAFLPAGIVPTSTNLLLTHLKIVALQQADGTWKFSSAQNTAVLP